MLPQILSIFHDICEGKQNSTNIDWNFEVISAKLSKYLPSPLKNLTKYCDTTQNLMRGNEISP